MHIEAQRFEKALEESTEWSDNLFRYCDFVNIDSEGEFKQGKLVDIR